MRKNAAVEARTIKGEETRQRILGAATSLFAEKGFHGTSITDIGERARIERGALYYHVKSKQHLLYAVLMGLGNDMGEMAEEVAADGALNAAEKLRRLLSLQVEGMLMRQQEMAVYERDLGCLSAEHYAELRAAQHRSLEVWKEIFEEGARTGLWPAVDAAARRGALEMISGVHHWYRHDGQLSSNEIAAQMSDFILRGLNANERLGDDVDV